MDLELQGETALVSGASAGIGRRTAATLASEGVQTIIVGRGEKKLSGVADEIEREGGPRPMVVVDDLTQREAFARVRDQVLERFGGIDILINNLGQARPFNMETPDSDWDAAFDLNFTPPRKLAEAFIGGMQERKFGRIVNLTGTAEPSHVSGSLTSKEAVVVFAKGLSRLVAKDGITVNCVSPGILMTEQIRDHYIPRVLPTAEDQERFLNAEIPARRFGEPVDAARLVTFLCSPLAGYITGQRIYVDGGWSRHT